MARKAVEKNVSKLEEKAKTMKEILQGGYNSDEFKRGNKKKNQFAERLEEESRNLLSRDIAAEMMKVARQVDVIAIKSGNLKGGFVRMLRESAASVEVLTDALACRVLPQEGEREREIKVLREEKSLREEIERLRADRDRASAPSTSEQVHLPSDRIETDGEEPAVRATLPANMRRPPVNRPPIKGISLVLSDGEDDEPSSLPPPTATKDTRKGKYGDIDSKFSAFAEQMRKEMGQMFSAFAERFAPQGLPNGARNSTFVASAQESGAAGGLVPEGKKGSEGNGKKISQKFGPNPKSKPPTAGKKVLVLVGAAPETPATTAKRTKQTRRRPTRRRFKKCRKR